MKLNMIEQTGYNIIAHSRRTSLSFCEVFVGKKIRFNITSCLFLNHLAIRR